MHEERQSWWHCAFRRVELGVHKYDSKYMSFSRGCQQAEILYVELFHSPALFLFIAQILTQLLILFRKIES